MAKKFKREPITKPGTYELIFYPSKGDYSDSETATITVNYGDGLLVYSILKGSIGSTKFAGDKAIYFLDNIHFDDTIYQRRIGKPKYEYIRPTEEQLRQVGQN